MGDSNGRLLRAYRGARRRVAGVVRGLIAAAVVLFCFHCSPVSASGPPPNSNSYDRTQAGQYAYCQALQAYWGDEVSGYGTAKSCYLVVSTGGNCFWKFDSKGNGSYASSTFNPCDASQDAGSMTCSGRPEITVSAGGSTTIDNAGCTYAPFGDEARMVCIDASGEHYCTGSLKLKPTGAHTSDTPPQQADPVPPIPKVCGGGSCFDPSSGQYCAVSSSGQVCVSAGVGAPQGGCATGGSVTVCAGSPAPLPPTSAVPDPATQIGSSDRYGDTKGSASSSVTVNNYDTSGAAPQSGAGAGDASTPPKDTDTGDKTAASGGGDCGSPPVVEGNAALGMVARQVWLARCQGDGGNSNDGDTTVPGLGGIGESPGPGFITETSLLDKLDGGGFGGGGQCPQFPDLNLDALGVSWNRSPQWWCDLLHALSFLIAALGAYAALAILGAFKR